MTIITERLERCRNCPIRHQAVCGALTDEEIQALSSVARQQKLNAGDLIQRAEDETLSFANIVSGTVKLSKVMSDGRQQIVGLQFPPDFLGRAYRSRSPYFAEAVTDVELCVFPKRTFEALMEKQPDLEKRLFQNTLDELDAARDWMLLLGRKSAAEKVASFLMLIARRKTAAPCDQPPAETLLTITLPLTRAEIADYLGLTLETVSRQVGSLRAADILETGANRTITILDYEGLAKAAQL